MKPVILASFVGAAILAAGVLLASDFGDWLSRADRSATVARSAPVVAAAKQQGFSSASLQNVSLQTVSLKVDNLWCASCPVIVRRALEQVEGVSEAHVSFRSKTATVVFDPTQCDAAKLTTATAALGYPSSVIR
jgi:mercuric ion binding protein